MRQAWDQGLAEAVARCAAKLAERVAAGDMRAISYFLSRKGGFAAPRGGVTVEVRASNATER